MHALLGWRSTLSHMYHDRASKVGLRHTGLTGARPDACNYQGPITGASHRGHLYTQVLLYHSLNLHI